MVDDFNPRSPHGERRALPLKGENHGYFNPRSPHGERRRRTMPGGAAIFISIHAPRTGSDHARCDALPVADGISIHAPRTGSDSTAGNCHPVEDNFNPRSPHGERPARKSCTIA